MFLNRRMKPSKFLRLALALAIPLFLAGFADPAQHSADRMAPHPLIPGVRVSDLPPEARRTLALIRKGGPYTHARDGRVFANREGLLPQAARGTYREYTVPTPGRTDRGARRIVAVKRFEFYYT